MNLTVKSDPETTTNERKPITRNTLETLTETVTESIAKMVWATFTHVRNVADFREKNSRFVRLNVKKPFYSRTKCDTIAYTNILWEQITNDKTIMCSRA